MIFIKDIKKPDAVAVLLSGFCFAFFGRLKY